MTDAWDPSIPSHKELAHGIEIGNGIPEMRPLAMARQAIKTVGFELVHEEDLADRPDPVPWYYPLEGDLSKAQTFWDLILCWRTSTSGKFVTHNGLSLLEFLRIIPKGTKAVCDELKVAGDALTKGGQTKVRSFHYHSMNGAHSPSPSVVHAYVPCHLPETIQLESS